MTLAKRRNVVSKLLIYFYKMFYRNFLSLKIRVFHLIICVFSIKLYKWGKLGDF